MPRLPRPKGLFPTTTVLQLLQMKKCTWCGKEYADDAVRCAVDGQPLSGEEGLSEGEPPSEQADPTWRPQFLNLLQVEGAFARIEGYLRPDWKKIREVIEKTVAAEDQGVAWTEAAM